jgi:hypothetical protein
MDIAESRLDRKYAAAKKRGDIDGMKKASEGYARINAVLDVTLTEIKAIARGNS